MHHPTTQLMAHPPLCLVLLCSRRVEEGVDKQTNVRIPYCRFVPLNAQRGVLAEREKTNAERALELREALKTMDAGPLTVPEGQMELVEKVLMNRVLYPPVKPVKLTEEHLKDMYGEKEDAQDEDFFPYVSNTLSSPQFLM